MRRRRRRDNLRRVITHFEAALEVRDHQAAPFDWAQTQQNLGAIYANYTFENPAEQIERAIAYYQAALEVYTHEVLPADWARTQFNLGLAFGDRQAGDRAENIEQALVCLQQALAIDTRQADPISWALGQAELGRMYTRRIRGDQAENIERAMDCLSRALEVYTREAFPLEWAKTQERLGQAYRQQIAGGLADSFDQASACLRRALEVYTASAAPARHVTLQFERLSRIQGNRTANIVRAIEHYQQALEVFTRDASAADQLRSPRLQQRPATCRCCRCTPPGVRSTAPAGPFSTISRCAMLHRCTRLTPACAASRCASVSAADWWPASPSTAASRRCPARAWRLALWRACLTHSRSSTPM
jgi:tetratricopeptide (TPR) repeat protein